MTGASDDYDDGDVDSLVDALEAAFADWWSGPVPSSMRVRADIEWNNSRNPRPVRTTTIPGLDLGPVRDAIAEARHARQAWQNARPGPKSWGAQFRQLSRTRAGRDALTAAGVSVTARTMARWQTGRQQPSRANRERIAAASAQRFEQQQAAREARYRELRRAAADALTAAVEDGTGADVRFRDVSELEFGW